MALIGCELILAYKQHKFVMGRDRLFGITEPIDVVAKRLSAKVAKNGAWYSWANQPVPKDFAIGTFPHTKVLGLNEGDGWKTQYTDKHGFFNDDSWWDDADWLMCGDSFATAQHLDFKDSPAALLRAAGVKVLNLGITGSGPTLQLAALKAFARQPHPSVIWLYYEGNDMADAVKEQGVPQWDHVLEPDYRPSPNPDRLEQLPTDISALFGLAHKCRTALVLSRVRTALQPRAGLPRLKAAILEAQRYSGYFILVRIRRLGLSDDKSWDGIQANVKLDIPNVPGMYSMGQDAHLSPRGYRVMVNKVLAAMPSTYYLQR